VALRVEERRMEITRIAEPRHITEWVMGVIGVLAAGVGAWMYYVPADWFLGGLAEGWFFGLFIAAGLLLAGAFGLLARKAFLVDEAWTVRVTASTVLSLLALAAAVIFAVILVI
jgi:ABC-type Na+ efflux pump permease subunit